jgi:hypothetical protein
VDVRCVLREEALRVRVRVRVRVRASAQANRRVVDPAHPGRCAEGVVGDRLLVRFGLVYCGHIGSGLTTTMRRDLRSRFDVIYCAATAFHGVRPGTQLVVSQLPTPVALRQEKSRDPGGRGA